jgi:hypothetical protein
MADHKRHREQGEGMLKRGGRALSAAVALLSLFLAPGIAHADGTSVGGCSDVDICVGAGTPGKSGGADGPDGGSHGSGGGHNQTCTLLDGTVTQCTPQYNAADHCFYELMDPQPPHGPGYTDMNGADTSGPGAFYQKDCVVNDVGGTVWLKAPPPTVVPDPVVLARQALSKMKLLGAAISSAPGAGKPGLVGMPVWLWNTRSANTWGPISATAAVPGLSVTATARVTKITYAMGDGGSAVCTTPGTPYQKSYADRSSPDCGYRYSKVSTGKPGGRFTVTATSSWEVTWHASTGQNGALPVETRTSVTTARVGELQVVN